MRLSVYFGNEKVSGDILALIAESMEAKKTFMNT